MSSIYKKLIEEKNAISCIDKYLHYLRKVKRGEIKDVPEHFKVFSDGVLMKKLITENLLSKKHLCSECGQSYKTVEDYYEHLPIIFLGVGLSNGITMVCNDDKCRKSAMKKLLANGD